MKKMTAKEKRELEQQKRSATIKQRQDAAVQKKAEKTAAMAEKSKSAASSKLGAGNGEANKKTSAKAAGLKSTLVLNDKALLMTSFGKGNAAIIEKRIENGKITSLAEEHAFEVSPAEKEYKIHGRIEAQASDPLCSPKKPGEDMIGAKDALEKRYFESTFEDNIHIQLIYNILDITKILAVHANNIVYTLDNLARDAHPEYNDFIGIGQLGRNSYEVYCDPTGLNPDFQRKINASRKEFEEYLENPRLAYFGNAFYRKLSRNERLEDGRIIFDGLPGAKQGQITIQARGNPRKLEDLIRDLAPEYKRRTDKDIYYILSMVSTLRQICVHDSDGTRSALYHLETELEPDALAVLNKIYDAKIDELDAFVKNNSKSNFTLLFRALNAQSDEEKCLIAQQYYDFSMRKEYKNTGFSIRVLREKILEAQAPHLKDEKYDSIRSKLYQMLDFFLWRVYGDEPTLGKELVAKLRTTTKNEQKDAIYSEEAGIAWKKLRAKVEIVEKNLSKVTHGDIKITNLKLSEWDGKLVGKAINDYKRRIKKNASTFSKLIYLVTLFLDGKEINDLLTTLRSKFEEIDSFLDVMKKEGLPCEFAKGYQFFDRSAVVADELQAINSFARMSKETISAKRIMFTDAATILGTSFDEKELDTYLNSNVLDKSKLKLLPNGKPNTGFRNFIISNVIESSHFRYLVRYGNPKKLRAIMENRGLVKFVLAELPDTQIDRYYEMLVGPNPCDKEKKIEALADKMTGLTFESFANVNQKANAKQNADKAKKQGIISLYLNVLYQVVKNLVYVNSRYTMAFQALERDSQLHKNNAGFKHKNYCTLTQKFLDEKRLNARACRYLQVNIGNSGDWECSVFRNQVAHLGAIRNLDLWVRDLRCVKSYFEVYHYLMQRAIRDQFAHDKTWKDKKRPGKMIISEEELNPRTSEYFGLVEQYRTYCMDFVKAYCAPFGYNLARYKNLSIDALFDKNHLPESEEERKRTIPERGC